MQTIWKYTLKPRCTFSMPQGANILSVGIQGDENGEGNIVMWVLVNPIVAREDRQFVVYGTGHEMVDEKIEFVGTVQMSGGPEFPHGLVFHAFEVKK